MVLALLASLVVGLRPPCRKNFFNPPPVPPIAIGGRRNQ